MRSAHKPGPFPPRHVLVAGGTGFVGRATVRRLLERTEARITVLSRTPGPAATEARLTVLAHDLGSSLARLDLPETVDLVLHCASPLGTAPDEVSAEALFAANVHGTFHLLDYATRGGARRFVYVSSGGVCGYHRRPIREDSPLSPPTPYLMAKLAGELAVRAHGGLPFTIARLFFPYGPGQARGLVPELAARMRKGEDVLVGRRGEPSVNPLHVEDAASLLVDISLDAQAPEVVNLAGSEVVTMRSLATLVGGAMGGRPSFREEPEQRLNMVGDTTLLVERYGPRAFRLAQGLRALRGEPGPGDA